jgi:type I restriction enzyme S subunit
MSFPAYPDYKDSGIEWLGIVPVTWRVGKFRHLFKESSEKIFDEVVGEMLSVSGYRGIEIKEYDDENRRRSPDDLLGYRIVRPGQLVVNTMWLNHAGLGVSTHTGHVSPAYRSYWVSPELHGGYTHYLMRSERQVKGYTKHLTGIRPNSLQMSRDDLMGFQVLIPPIEEQAAIATFLDRETAKIDALVAEQEKLIELLKEKRQAVISHAVTKGLDPSAPMKDSGIEWLGEVPAHWGIIPLKYVVQFTSGGTPAKDVAEYWDGDIPWASAKDLKSETLSRTQKTITESAIDDGRAALIESGSVVVVVRGMILARTFPVSLTLRPLAINQDLKALTCASECSASYLSWYLRGTESETISRLDEAGHGTKALRMDAWSSLPVCLPPIDEQQEITHYIKRQTHTLDALGGECSAAISFLKELRTALISAAVTGKIDVRGLVAAKETEAA